MTGRLDGQLLADVAASGSQESFEELVRRHGAMVLAACRRFLNDAQDAEDAAQAVFLLLWRKAGSLRGRSTVAGWLHQVARKVCGNARRAQEARRRHEREAAELGGKTPHNRDAWSEIKELLDEELDRLPEKYRLPFILFHLENRSLEEIAALLDTKSSTVGTRLSRARELLRSRLARKGITMTVATLTATLAANAAAAAAPATFVTTTTHAASLFAAGKVTAEGILSGKTAALAQGASKMLTVAKLKIAAAAVAGATVVASGVALSQAPEPPPTSPTIQAVSDAYEAGRKQVRNMLIEFRLQAKPIADQATLERLGRYTGLLQDETITFVADLDGFVWRVEDHRATARNVRETSRRRTDHPIRT